MRKFIIGMIAVLGVHIVFVAFFATLDTVESARERESLKHPITTPTASLPVVNDEITIARGTVPEEPADVTPTNSKPATAGARNPRKIEPRLEKPFKPTPKRVVPAYQTAAFKVERTEFPQNMTFTASDAYRSEYSAATKKTGKRSFLSKVGSIVKKPYDGLKAVASWLR